MLHKIGVKFAVVAWLMLCTVQPASAGWFEDAVDGAKERVGTRAVDEAADGAYDAAKDAAFSKSNGGNQGNPSASEGSTFREPERHRPAAGLAGDAIDDDHFIQKDDYFISTTALEKNPYISVSLAKMVTEPSTRSKGEAEFFKVIDGSNIWTRHYYQSRIARDGEIKLGTIVMAFEGRTDDTGVYIAPETKEEARGASWFLAKITDASDLYRGYVTVSGNYKVNLKNLRILLPKSLPAAR